MRTIEGGGQPLSRRELIARAVTSAAVLVPSLAHAELNIQNRAGEGTAGSGATASTTSSRVEWVEPTVTDKAHFSFSLDGKDVGIVSVVLYGKEAPQTVDNFKRLITGENELGVTYKGSKIYRIIDGISLQGGAIGDEGGRGLKGTSAAPDGQPLAPENYNIQHGTRGMLSMVRGLDGVVDSRFFFTLGKDAHWADGRYVAFGRVVDGWAVLEQLQKVSVKPPSNAPAKAIVITDCGLD